MTSDAASCAVVHACGERRPRVPGDRAWFDPRRELGRGYRHLPDASLYLLAAARQAQLVIGESTNDHWGVCIASLSGSARLHDTIDESVISGAAHLISPTLAPHFSHNLLASRLAMEYGITGPCLSVHTPITAGLDALALAVNMIESDRATNIVVGAVEAPRHPCARGAHSEGAVVMTLSDARGRQFLPGTAQISIEEYPRNALSWLLERSRVNTGRTIVSTDAATAVEIDCVRSASVQLNPAYSSLSTLGPIVDMVRQQQNGRVITVSESIVVAAVQVCEQPISIHA